MKRMIYTHYKNDNVVEEIVLFMSAYYNPQHGQVRALVMTKDNIVNEVNPACLSLSTDEYNKIFIE